MPADNFRRHDFANSTECTGDVIFDERAAMATDYAFTMDTSSIKVGPGVTREVGDDMRRLGCSRALVMTDPTISELAPVAVVRESLAEAGVEVAIYARVRVEPTDVSLKDATDFTVEGKFDGIVAVGAMPQHRVTKLSPRPASEDDLRKLFLDAMSYW